MLHSPNFLKHRTLLWLPGSHLLLRASFESHSKTHSTAPTIQCPIWTPHSGEQSDLDVLGPLKGQLIFAEMISPPVQPCKHERGVRSKLIAPFFCNSFSLSMIPGSPLGVGVYPVGDGFLVLLSPVLYLRTILWLLDLHPILVQLVAQPYHKLNA